MGKLDFSGKVINMLGDAYYKKVNRSVTNGNDVDLYLKAKKKGVNVIKVTKLDDGYQFKAMLNNAKAFMLEVVYIKTISSDEALVEELKKYI